MNKLTKAEEEVMQVIWQRKNCLVSQILDDLKDASGKKPPHSTISSIVRILEKKGFVDHKAYGRTHEYFAVVEKSAYSKRSLRGLVENYFGGSAKQLVSFLVQEEDLSREELEGLIDQLEEE